MKKVLVFLALFMGLLATQNAKAQVLDVSNDKGCIADFNYQKADCYECGQEMPDGSGFCQQGGGLPCPKCWTLEEAYWDENLQTQVYTLTIDPDGTPTIKQVHSVSRIPQVWGVALNYIEI